MNIRDIIAHVRGKKVTFKSLLFNLSSIVDSSGSAILEYCNKQMIGAVEYCVNFLSYAFIVFILIGRYICTKKKAN